MAASASASSSSSSATDSILGVCVGGLSGLPNVPKRRCESSPSAANGPLCSTCCSCSCSLAPSTSLSAAGGAAASRAALDAELSLSVSSFQAPPPNLILRDSILRVHAYVLRIYLSARVEYMRREVVCVIIKVRYALVYTRSKT